MTFEDRHDAGRQLAQQLAGLKSDEPLILALPRGGVEVGVEVAAALDGQLDVWVVRKLGVPGQEELGMGALAEGGGVWLNRDLIARLGITQAQITEVADREAAELERRVRRYRGVRTMPAPGGRTVIVVDDGIATGGTVHAALQAIRAYRPRRLVLAVPVSPPDSLEELQGEADELVCLSAPVSFMAVGQFYRRFGQTSDEEVVRLLDGARARWSAAMLARGARPGTPPRPRQAIDREVRIPAGRTELDGQLGIPGGARGLVLFAHGSGSSRFSPRNRQVAGHLRHAGLGTLLIDLLTAEEEREDEVTGSLRFDIPFLAERLVDVSEWLATEPGMEAMALGLFGSSTGAAAALVAAALWPERIRAVVSRGGRPDLAGRYLARVRAPTLLLVGGLDGQVIDLNREALQLLGGEKQLRIVEGAGHLFSQPGTLEEVAELAAGWFTRHLVQAAAEMRP